MRTSGPSSALQLLLRPDVLFTIATFQGLSPYVFWPLGVGAAVPSTELSYLPALIALTGCAAFAVGASLVWTLPMPETRFVFSPFERRIRSTLWVGLLAGCAEVYLTIRVYGAIPLISYIQGDTELNAGSATDLQDGSFVGQIALLNLTVTLLGALLLCLAVCAIEQRKKVSPLFYFGLFASVLLSIFNAKRIGMVRIFVMLISGLLLYNRETLTNLTAVLPFVRSRRAAMLGLLSLPLIIFAIFGPIAELRNPGAKKTSSFQQVVAYQQDVILNMEEQTSKAGLGPYTFRFLPPFSTLVPIKFLSETSLNVQPPKIDYSSPNGFFEMPHWCWGPIGCLLFAAFLGALCMWLYRSARSGGGYLMSYAYIVSSLLLSHTINEFLIAPLVLVPCLSFAVMAKLFTRPSGGGNNKEGNAAKGILRLRRCADYPARPLQQES